MKTTLQKIVLLLLTGTLTACLKNDIPFPYIALEVFDLTFEGQMGAAQINKEARTITVQLADTVLLNEVRLDSMRITEGARSTLNPGSVIDLSQSSYQFTLSLYQDYTWTVLPKQHIDYLFKVRGQVGETVIDPINHRAVAYVSKETDLKNIVVEELKLGPTNSSYTPDKAFLTDFTKRKSVIVFFKDEMTEWSLYVFQTDSNVNTGKPAAWVNVAWLYGSGRADATNGFEMRRADETEWTKVDESMIETDGGNFSARITRLAPSTSYVYRAFSNDEYGAEVEFTTVAAQELPNASFETWTKDKNVWNPWGEEDTPFWSTGNKGSSTLGESNTIPSDETFDGSVGKSAQLCSRFVGIASIGKFAAGNIYVGDFVKVDGTNGILNFGKPYHSYPTKLSLHYKYTTAPINYASGEWADLKGRPDTCAVYIALGDWSEPVEIRTRPSNLKLFDKNDPHIIAYSEFYSGDSTDDWTKLELELDYRAKDRVPTYIIVVCSASKYGDYFTGGAGATLWVDNLKLSFDY